MYWPHGGRQQLVSTAHVHVIDPWSPCRHRNTLRSGLIIPDRPEREPTSQPAVLAGTVTGTRTRKKTVTDSQVLDILGFTRWLTLTSTMSRPLKPVLLLFHLPFLRQLLLTRAWGVDSLRRGFSNRTRNLH